MESTRQYWTTLEGGGEGGGGGGGRLNYLQTSSVCQHCFRLFVSSAEEGSSMSEKKGHAREGGAP